MKKYLDFAWRFQPGFLGQYLQNLPNNSALVDLPHAPVSVPMNYFSEEAYQGLFSYEKIFDADVDEKQIVFLVFEGVMLKVHPYLNGTDLGEKISGWVSVRYDITSLLKAKNNRLQ